MHVMVKVRSAFRRSASLSLSCWRTLGANPSTLKVRSHQIFLSHYQDDESHIPTQVLENLSKQSSQLVKCW
ncbi:hypothetical protein [Nostoc sp.]|uniref:hypothetical protein n=1 Tax=Nostoc sp. TaxID=1180 RepID=UPI002FF47C8F